MNRLEDFFKRPTAMQRLRANLFGAHLDKFCASLSDQGFRKRTIKNKVGIVDRFSRWMVGQRLAVEDLDERDVKGFVDAQRRRGPNVWQSIRPTLLFLLEHLRSEGVIPAAVTACDNSPGAVILARYAAYLRCERGLAANTIEGCVRGVRPFVTEWFDRTATAPTSLCADDVRDCLLAQVRHMAPRNAQWTGSVLRSFLRFLFLRGETSCDLALAVPRMRQYRLVSVPRHMPPEDIERLLDDCIRSSSATRRRDYAILLLMARLGLRAGEEPEAGVPHVWTCGSRGRAPPGGHPA